MATRVRASSSGFRGLPAVTGTAARRVCGWVDAGAKATAGNGAATASVLDGADAGAEGAMDGPISMGSPVRGTPAPYARRSPGVVMRRTIGLGQPPTMQKALNLLPSRSRK